MISGQSGRLAYWRRLDGTSIRRTNKAVARRIQRGYGQQSVRARHAHCAALAVPSRRRGDRGASRLAARDCKSR